jgi:riboflavin biosynthesis pyrimidine reductase
VGGGAIVVRDFLKAGLVDHLHVAIAPILLGGGIRLWDGLRGLDSELTSPLKRPRAAQST